jgi:hypothetical protein
MLIIGLLVGSILGSMIGICIMALLSVNKFNECCRECEYRKSVCEIDTNSSIEKQIIHEALTPPSTEAMEENERCSDMVRRLRQDENTTE